MSFCTGATFILLMCQWEHLGHVSTIGLNISIVVAAVQLFPLMVLKFGYYVL